MIDNKISVLKELRDNVYIEIKHWFNFIVKLGEEVNTVPPTLRLAKRRTRFRPNIILLSENLGYCISWSYKFAAKSWPET